MVSTLVLRWIYRGLFYAIASALCTVCTHVVENKNSMIKNRKAKQRR